MRTLFRLSVRRVRGSGRDRGSSSLSMLLVVTTLLGLGVITYFVISLLVDSARIGL